MAPVCVLVTLTAAPTSTPPVASVTMPVIWPNVWAREAMGTARKRLVEKTSERPRRIAHLVSFLVATGGGKIRMRQYHAVQERHKRPKDGSAFERPTRVDVVHNALRGLQRSRRVPAPAPRTSTLFWLRCCSSRSV